MLRYFVLSLCVCGVYLFPEGINKLEAPTDGKLWALLVAGSDTWMNYRHQADICHSYQVLHRHGIPDEQIVVMMTDDLAFDSENPTPGVVINHPNGADVYHGVPHDYTGESVTPENFLAILQGNTSGLRGKGSGKVINSGPNDHVFVYFADHGAPGIIAFPESELSATDLNKAIMNMYKQKRYNKMVLYIEACESGSMFKGLLPDDINVYATTAANPSESSYACYFDDKRDTYLGDVYSVNWMEDSDKEVLTDETLAKQFKIVKKETNTSHVQQYGDLSINKMHVSEFQGQKQAEPIILPKAPLTPMRSRDVPLDIAKRKVLKAQSPEEMSELQKKVNRIIRNRLFLSKKVMEIVSMVSRSDVQVTKIWQGRSELQDFACYNEVRAYFNEECFKLSKNEYALDFMYVLVNLCENGVSPRAQKQAMERVCTHPPIYGIV